MVLKERMRLVAEKAMIGLSILRHLHKNLFEVHRRAVEIAHRHTLHHQLAQHVRTNVRADDILPKLRDQGQRIAIVRDKASPCLGIVTIDSLLNAIVGNLPRGISGDRKPSPRFGKRSREGVAR